MEKIVTTTMMVFMVLGALDRAVFRNRFGLGNEFVKGATTAGNGIFPVGRMVGNGSPLEHTVCTNCGSIVRTQVLRVDKLCREKEAW